MAKFTLSEAAAAALEDIYLYSIRNFGTAQADRYVSQIVACAEKLAADMLRGTAYTTKKGVTYLRYPSGRHVIFYRRRADDIFIVHILHQAQNVDEHL